MAKTPEEFTYDDDGNMLTDGRWTYTWNGENRLISAIETDKCKIEFEYDYMGRRTSRKEYSWVSSAWQLDSTEKYVWDEYNIIAVYDGNDNLLKSYLWGEDLSGTLQGAGGVGGLLAVNDGTNVYCPIYDGNGNITQYVDSADGSLVASYEYNPFGRVTCKYGSKVGDFANQFSTKPYDAKLDSTLFELRILKNGRWLSRDPLGEAGGYNLYAFVNNDGINTLDLLGLKDYEFTYDHIPRINLRIPLWLLWVRIKIKAAVKLVISTDATITSCPTKYPRNIKVVNDINTYTEDDAFGVKTKHGLEGDDFKLLFGGKLGVTLKGKSYWAKVFNSTIDKGTYKEVDAEVQYMINLEKELSSLTSKFPQIQSKIKAIAKEIKRRGHTTCICVNAKPEIEHSLEGGINPGGIGAVAGVAAGVGIAKGAIAVIIPVLDKLKDILIPPQPAGAY